MKICWNLFSKRVHILVAVLLSTNEYRFLSIISRIKLLFLVRAIKYFFFSTLNIKTVMSWPVLQLTGYL